MLALFRRAFMTPPDRSSALRAQRQQELKEHREKEAERRRDDETCHYCRGSRMCHFCGGVRQNSHHELGADCRYCRDGRCSFC